MIGTLRDTYSVAWADIQIVKHLWRQLLLTSLMSPALYLVAFGYGLGRGMTVLGHPYLEFVIPGIISLTTMNTSFNAAGMKLNVDRLFYRSFDEILMSPVSPVSLVLGKSLIGVIRGLGVSLVFVAIGLVVSPITVGPLFIVTLVASCLLFSFLGVLCAMYAKSHQDMATFTSVILTPMTFLGGTFFSLSRIPVWLKVLLNVLPLTHVSACLRAEALGTPFPWSSLLALVAGAAVLFGLCVRVVKRASV